MASPEQPLLLLESAPHLVRCREFTLHRDHPLVHPDLGLLSKGYLRAGSLEEGRDVRTLAPDHQPAGRQWNEHALPEGERWRWDKEKMRRGM